MVAWIQNRIATIGGSSLLRRAAMVAGGAAAGQLTVAAASPLLSRWFAPESFGVFGAFVGIATILGTCGALRYELAIQTATTDREADDVARLAVRTAASSSLIALLVVAILAMSGALSSIDGVGSALWLVPPTMFSITMFNIGVFWSIRQARFRSVARARVTLGMATVAPQLVAGFFGAGIVGLLVGPLIGWGAAALLLLASTGFRPQAATSEPVARLASKHRRFPLFSVWSALFKRGALEVPAVMLLALFDQRSAGLFYLCNRVLIVPANVVAEGIYQSFLNRSGELARTDAKALRNLTRTTVRTLALLVLLPVAAGMFVVPMLLPLVFGPAWDDAGPLALRLVPMVGALLIAVPVSSQLWLLGRQDLELIRDAARFAAVVGVFILGGINNWSLATTVTGYSIVMGAAYLLTVVLVLHVTAQHRVSHAPLPDPDPTLGRLKAGASHG